MDPVRLHFILLPCVKIELVKHSAQNFILGILFEFI